MRRSTREIAFHVDRRGQNAGAHLHARKRRDGQLWMQLIDVRGAGRGGDQVGAGPAGLPTER